MTYASPASPASRSALRMAGVGKVLLVIVTGLVLVAAGSCLLAGFRVRTAAMVLAARLVPISVTALVGMPGEMGPLMKNVALFGGLLQLAAASCAGGVVSASERTADATEGS